MSDRFHLPRAWPERLAEFKIPLPAPLRRAGLPEILFQQEKIYATTAQVFALWRAVRKMTPDPATVAAVCGQSFRDALQRIALYKQLVSANEQPQRLP